MESSTHVGPLYNCMLTSALYHHDFAINYAACARDTVTNEYCITDANGLRLILQLASLNVSGGPCFNTDCSDITCASAVGNVSTSYMCHIIMSWFACLLPFAAVLLF